LKLLYIATSFPEPHKGATIYTDLAEALHEAGHEITVAVSEQPRNLKQTTMNIERGFDVLRVVTGNYYDVGLLEKGLTTLKIPRKMKQGILHHLSDREFDFILYEAPPVTNASLVIWAKKRFNCPSYLMLKDIFPQNAVDIGMMKKNGLIYQYFLKKETQLYNSADIIGCMSEGNRNYILKHNPFIDEDKVEIFPNTKKITDDYRVDNYVIREKYSIPNETCVFLFGGNMGKPQYIDLLCKAIVECKDDENIFFLFVGRGTERYKIEQIIKKEAIKNALLVENLPRDEYEQMTKECNVGLIVLDPKFSIPNYPSRILSYLEYGKPVLAATDNVTDLKHLIEDNGCGEWVWSGDKDTFIDAIKSMTNRSDLNNMGKVGRSIVEKEYTVEKSVKILERHFN